MSSTPGARISTVRLSTRATVDVDHTLTGPRRMGNSESGLGHEGQWHPSWDGVCARGEGRTREVAAGGSAGGAGAAL